MIDRKLLHHAPPRLSDLHGDERRRACVERYDAATKAWQDQYRNPKPTLFERIKGAFRP